jgi:hypothetical protein
LNCCLCSLLATQGTFHFEWREPTKKSSEKCTQDDEYLFSPKRALFGSLLLSPQKPTMRTAEHTLVVGCNETQADHEKMMKVPKTKEKVRM